MWTPLNNKHPRQLPYYFKEPPESPRRPLGASIRTLFDHFPTPRNYSAIFAVYHNGSSLKGEQSRIIVRYHYHFANGSVSSIIIFTDAAGLKRQNLFKLTCSDFLVIFNSGLYLLNVISTHCDSLENQAQGFENLSF